MGSILDIIWSSPLPTVIVAVIATALAAGYWFFVLPMLADIKKLRQDNATALSTIENFQTEFSQITQALSTSNTLLKSSYSLAERQTKQLSLISQQSAHIAQRTKALEEHLVTLQLLERNTENALRILSDVSDKQSQLSGVIYGLNLRGTQPPRGP